MNIEFLLFLEGIVSYTRQIEDILSNSLIELYYYLI